MCPPLERPRFFSGKLLTADDFAQEQDYFREKLKRHNQSLHGFGIINGLKVKSGSGSGSVVVGPGMALDCEGNELVVEAALTITLPALTQNTAYVSLKFYEEPLQTGLQEALSVRESVEVIVAQENCNHGHRHLRARWLACGKPHPLTIARLKPGAREWRVDARYRPPAVK